MMLTKINVDNDLLKTGYTAFHNWLNTTDALDFNKIDLSQIDDLKKYVYKTVTRHHRYAYLYEYMCQFIVEKYHIKRESLYLIGDGYFLVNN